MKRSIQKLANAVSFKSKINLLSMLLVENKASGPLSSKKLLNLMQVVLPIARFGLKSSPVIFTRVRFLALKTELWKIWAK